MRTQRTIRNLYKVLGDIRGETVLMKIYDGETNDIIRGAEGRFLFTALPEKDTVVVAVEDRDGGKLSISFSPKDVKKVNNRISKRILRVDDGTQYLVIVIKRAGSY